MAREDEIRARLDQIDHRIWGLQQQEQGLEDQLEKAQADSDIEAIGDMIKDTRDAIKVLVEEAKALDKELEEL